MSAAASNAPAPERLYRIGDVSRLTDTKPFVLRFWETEFPMLQPVKAPKGHRLYRQEDIDLILTIKRLLYEEGFTIAGARRHLAEALARSEGLALLTAATPSLAFPSDVAAHDVDGRGTACRAPTADAGAQGDTTPPSLLSTNARSTLLTIREELRAILTLLGTR